MTYALHDILGNIGVALILLTYLSLQLEKISSDSLFYSIYNAIGAGLILLSLYYEFNLSAFIVEVFWVLISLLGIYKAVKKKLEPMEG